MKSIAENIENVNYLTLTRVVFELQHFIAPFMMRCNLTLTRVVFECGSSNSTAKYTVYLTLTRVVFEFLTNTATLGFAGFNFNKSCI